MKQFRLARWMALPVLLSLWVMPLRLSSQGPSPGIDATRDAFVACVKKSTTLLLKVEGANPRAFNYFTSLSCSSQREAYRAALTAARYPDVDQMMTRIDVAMTLYMRNAWAAANKIPVAPAAPTAVPARTPAP